MGRRLHYDKVRRRKLGCKHAKPSDCVGKIGPLDQEVAKVARQLRTRFVTESPNASDAEIDERVATVMAAWSTPTEEEKPAKLEVPKAVLAVRRKARRAEVKKRA